MEEQIEKAKQGDKQAFTNLILEYKEKLYQIARARMHNHDDIDDIIQNTIILAYTNLKKLKDKERFVIWITRILINQCNDFYRKNKIVYVSFETLENSIENREAIDSQERIEYEEILNLLNGEEKVLIVLYYGQGYTTKQISEILNKNENTIKTKLRRTKEKIRKEWKGGKE